jgi:intracellular sulfur oxidation DsrE/DsrF family protein
MSNFPMFTSDTPGKISILLLVLTGLFFSITASAADTVYRHPDVEALLADDAPIDGVVFEVLTGQKNSWEWAAPMLAQFRKQITEKFPGMDIVVVSHGREQFELTKNHAAVDDRTLQTLRNLSSEGVNIHVCGVHSAWKNIEAGSYLDFVDVSASGPAQINDYVKLGYKRITLRHAITAEKP